MQKGNIAINTKNNTKWTTSVGYKCICVDVAGAKKARLLHEQNAISDTHDSEPDINISKSIKFPSGFGLSIDAQGSYDVFLGLSGYMEEREGGGVRVVNKFRALWVRDPTTVGFRVTWMGFGPKMPFVAKPGGPQVLADQWTVPYIVECSLGAGNKPVLTIKTGAAGN